MKKLFILLLVTITSVLPTHASDNYVRVSGTRLLGRDGARIVLRGTNCGNWMVREPYMMNTSGNLDRQFKFDKMLADVCGEEKVQEFDRLWMDNNFGEADMKFLAEQGFNTLRVPMHYKYFTLPIEREPVAGEQTWLQEGFDRIDSMCVWAERYGILLILDMHACPGGQSSGDICDYDASKPSLWESEANRTKLALLWRKIAERYESRKCVAAYDLINETNWTLPNSNKLLWDTFKAIIKAIREVDTSHIVILEGNSYSNDYTGLPSSKMDAKMILQFHRYGVYNTKSQVQYMADLASKYSCPVYIGEFGENSNSWTADCIRLYEEAMNFAGWSCWPMKKSNINSILQVKRVASYDNVISQWQNGTTPSSQALWSACKAWAEAQNISRCTVRTDYLDALLRRPYNNDCLPFGDNGYQTGDYVYAAHFDMGPLGRAYWDTNDASYQYSGESFTNWQTGWVYRNDGVDLYSEPNDQKSCGYYVGETKDGEWIQYTIENPNEAASWQLQLRYAINSGTSKVRITVNDRTVVPSTTLQSTGGYTSWNTKVFRGIILPEGTLRVRLYIEKGGLNINWLRFTSMKAATEQELETLKPDEDEARNRLMNGECEYQGVWRTAALASINNTKLTWNQTSNTPSQGEGGALCISSAREHSLNVALYQPVEVEAGHIYSADVAVRGAEGNGDFWIQAFMVTGEPKDYADAGLDEANTIGQLNSWKDGTLAKYDGLMSAKAKVGTNHTAGVMKWKATTTGTAYFVLKVGSNKSSFTYTFDNFTLKDLTAIETGIESIQNSKFKIQNETGQMINDNDNAVYDLAGRKISNYPLSIINYQLPKGLYINNGQKIFVRSSN
ncbi:MAG: cellulase family glycosylhydrolase [Bacteroidaceae bacterium]|nr:cellulase family glycosylhydrolase [Bacteroidaceae bacterium]